jgi:hypothetical protein
VNTLCEAQVAVVAHRHSGRFGQRERVGRVLVHRPERELAELGHGIGGKELRAAVDRVNGLAGAGFARIPARQLRVDRLQSCHDGREVVTI